MTGHRLIRCEPSQLVRHASAVHGTSAPDDDGRGADGGPKRWRYAEPPAGSSTEWRTRLPDGSVLSWCLEVEPGANGAMAHLTVALVTGRLTLLPATVQRLALVPFTERELTALARAVEPVAA